MDKELLKRKMIASVAMAATGEATDIDKRIEILTDVCVILHNECKTYDPLTEHERLRSGICTSMALMHLFMEKYGVEPLMKVLQKAQVILGDTLKIDRTILKALIDAGCIATEVNETE